MAIRFKSKSEKDYYNHYIQKGMTPLQAEREVRMFRKTSRRINKSIKKKFPGLRM